MLTLQTFSEGLVLAEEAISCDSKITYEVENGLCTIKACFGSILKSWGPSPLQYMDFNWEYLETLCELSQLSTSEISHATFYRR